MNKFSVASSQPEIRLVMMMRSGASHRHGACLWFPVASSQPGIRLVMMMRSVASHRHSARLWFPVASSQLGIGLVMMMRSGASHRHGARLWFPVAKLQQTDQRSNTWIVEMITISHVLLKSHFHWFFMVVRHGVLWTYVKRGYERTVLGGKDICMVSEQFLNGNE